MAPVFWLLSLFHAHHRLPALKATPIAETIAYQCSVYQVAQDGGDTRLMDQARLSAQVMLKHGRLRDLEFSSLCPIRN